jgi:hypothetical protein
MCLVSLTLEVAIWTLTHVSGVRLVVNPPVLGMCLVSLTLEVGIWTLTHVSGVRLVVNPQSWVCVWYH